MQRSSTSIRTILLLMVSGLTLLIALITVREVFEQWERLSGIRTLKDATFVSERFFDVLEDASREREITFALLLAPDGAVMPDLHAKLERSRQKTDAAMQQITAAWPRFHRAMLTTPTQDPMNSLTGLTAMRASVDAALALPRADRDPSLPRRWLDTSSETIGQIYDQWLGFTQHFTQIDPIVTQRMMFQHFLGLIIRYSGRERAMIGSLIVANQPIISSDQALLLQWHGVIGQGWEMCARLSERSRLAPAITPYLNDAESHYLTVYGMVEQLFYVPGAPPVTTYPIDIEQWLEVANGSTDSLNVLKNVAMEQTHTYVELLEQDARKNIALHTAVLAVALLLCLYSFYVITRRVIAPIHQMIDALLDTAAGKAVTRLPVAAQTGDEIGKLADVLHALQASSERYRALIEASSQVVWVWKEGNIDGMSPLATWWEATTGQPAEAIQTLGWLDVVHPDDREPMQEIWENALAKGVNYEMEYRIRARTGNYLYIYVRGVPLLAPDGSVRELIGTLSDITQRKEAEEQLQRYMRDLERSNKELDDFAYIASHDLKEPLRGIHNHSRFLLEDNEGKLEKESTDRLHRLLYLTQRMEKLVNDLLYFSRLGRHELAIQPTDLNAVVHDIETMTDLLLHERHAKILIPKPLPTLVCDKTRITEAFRNLIINAVKYNDKPEKIIEVGCLPHQRSPNGSMMRDVLYVKDNGLGIATEFHGEIFRIFKRLQNNAAGEDGTGVGLTFVKKIIERHGGKIWLESTLGQGTTFYFTLGRITDEPESTA